MLVAKQVHSMLEMSLQKSLEQQDSKCFNQCLEVVGNMARHINVCDDMSIYEFEDNSILTVVDRTNLKDCFEGIDGVVPKIKPTINIKISSYRLDNPRNASDFSVRKMSDNCSDYSWEKYKIKNIFSKTIKKLDND